MNYMNAYLRNGSIAVIDSGIGGVSVLSELMKVMPGESYIYFGDIQNAPYGERSTDEVRELTFRNVEFLLSKGAKAIVIACNTATGAAAKELREKYPFIPIIGIEPAIKPAVTAFKGQSVLIMATPLTLKQEKFEALRGQWRELAKTELLPCPGLAAMIEQRHTDDDVLREYLTTLFAPYKSDPPAAIVLGCTHYPLIKSAINEIFPQTVIFDGGEGTARQTKRRLEEEGLLNEKDEGKIEVFTSSEGIEAAMFATRVMDLTSNLCNM